MPRILLPAIAAIILGVSTSLAVALVCAAIAPSSTATMTRINADIVMPGADGVGTASLERAHALGWAYFESHEPFFFFRTGMGPVRRADDRDLLRQAIPHELVTHVVPWLDPSSPPSHPYSFTGRRVLAAGWPNMAFWCEFNDDGTPAGRLVPAGGVAIEDSPSQYGAFLSGLPPRTIPLRPLWRGLALNSLLFAALWSLPFAALATRRALRARRQNLCRTCGYSRLGLHPTAPCPECGNVTPAQQQDTKLSNGQNARVPEAKT